MKNQKIIYYDDELNEEFSTAQIVSRTIDRDYKYIHKNIIWRVCAFLVQNLLSLPIKYLYSKIKFKTKYVGKEKFKICKDTGYFIYGNHTQPFADTFLISNANFPKRNYFIVNPENVSMKFLGNFVQMLGAIPIPTEKKAMKHFLDAIEKNMEEKHSITIFPEAHIWPYCTKIRPFTSVSFKYPVRLNKPAYCVTNTYQSYGEKNEKVKIVSYIDGPFYPDSNMILKEAQEDLRNRIYETMVERSKKNNVEVIKYIKRNMDVEENKEKIKIKDGGLN